MTINSKKSHKGEFVTANVKLTREAHTKLRKLASDTGLNNSEILAELLEKINLQEAEHVLKELIDRKKQDRREKLKLRKEIDAMPPERVKAILASLHE